MSVLQVCHDPNSTGICGYHGGNQLQKPVSQRRSEVCISFPMGWADIGTVNLAQNSKAAEKVHGRDEHHTFSEQ